MTAGEMKTLRWLRLCISTTLDLPNTLHTVKPSHTSFGELFHSWFQLRLMQVEIINCANTQDTQSWESLATTIHQCAAIGTEIIRHLFAGTNCLRLAKGFEVLLAAYMLQVLVIDGEVGCEH